MRQKLDQGRSVTKHLSIKVINQTHLLNSEDVQQRLNNDDGNSCPLTSVALKKLKFANLQDLMEYQTNSTKWLLLS